MGPKFGIVHQYYFYPGLFIKLLIKMQTKHSSCAQYWKKMILCVNWVLDKSKRITRHIHMPHTNILALCKSSWWSQKITRGVNVCAMPVLYSGHCIFRSFQLYCHSSRCSLAQALFLWAGDVELEHSYRCAGICSGWYPHPSPVVAQSVSLYCIY